MNAFTPTTPGTTKPATRAAYDERAYVFHGTVTAAAVRHWLKP
ncbi:hypothetical protein ACF1CG_10900 [Streptomyces sp. NPDC014773]